MGSEARKRSREKLREQREKEKRAAKRNRTLIVVGAAAAVVLLVVGIGYAVLTSDSGDGYDGPLAAQTLQDDGSVVMAEPDAAGPVVEVYADYQCPACRQFEHFGGDVLKEQAAAGAAIVHYRPVSIFAQQPVPISSNSLRAGAAARAAADHGVFVEYNDTLFENQPTEGKDGFGVDELQQWFRDTGASDEDAQAFDDRVDGEAEIVREFTEDYLPALTADATEQIGQENIGTMVLSDLISWGESNGHDASFLEGTYTGEIIDATGKAYTRYSGANEFRATPSVYINGELLDGNTAMSPRGLADAIADAGDGEVSTEPKDADGGGDAEENP